MTKPNFHHIISLDQETETRTQKLQEEGKKQNITITIIGIYREGLERLEKKVYKN